MALVAGVITDRAPDTFAALMAALGRLADEMPDAPALTSYRGRTVTGRIGRRELLHRVAALQRYLGVTLGVAHGDRIAVLATNHLEIPVLYLAALRLGAVLVPLNPNTPPDYWRFLVEEVDARLLVADGDLLPRVPALRVPVCRLEEMASAGPAPAAEPPTPRPEDLALVHDPGGSPRRVLLSQRALLASAWSVCRALGLDGTVQMTVQPPFHAHALGFGLMTALVSGSHLVLCERFDPFAWAEVIAHEQVTVTSLVPTFLPPLMEARVRASMVPTLRHTVVSSAPLAPALARQFEDTTGLPLLHAWGLAEFGSFACCLSPSLPDDIRRRLLHGGRDASVGGPLPGTEVKVVGADGRPAPAGTTGELWVRGPSRMLGYLRDDAANREVLDGDGWLRTGDEGYWRPMADGDAAPVFFVTGRLKQIIIRGGEKLSPAAIEDKLLAALPELAGRLAVVGFPHRVLGEEVGAYLQAPALDGHLQVGLVAALDTLGPDLRPKVVLHGAAPLPRGADGSVLRRDLTGLFTAYADCRGPVQFAPA
jgi:long-chain acyl-CoA synthetase